MMTKTNSSDIHDVTVAEVETLAGGNGTEGAAIMMQGRRRFSVFTALAFMTTFASLASTYDVRSFGAKGDGVTKDTAYIQAAIDAAARAGGGRVEVGPGTYLSGSIFLKSNIDFHLSPGAVLLGSPNRSDYNSADVCPQNRASPLPGDNHSGGHLILCIAQKNVSISGSGRIDGNSYVFFHDKAGKAYEDKTEIPWRPGQMIWFVDSCDIRIKDIEIANAPYWSCFLLNCDRVFISNAYVHTVRKPWHTINGDGIDIDRSRHVSIRGCRIDTADDCITLRASSGDRLDNPHDCAFVTVSDCNLSSSCNAIRPGVGEGRVHDAVFSNLTIGDTRTAFNFVCGYSRKSRGADITGIRVSNVRIDAMEFLKMHHMYAKDAEISDIVFDGVSGDVRRPSVIYAKAVRPFHHVKFLNVEIPCGIRMLNVRDCAFVGGSFSELTMSEDERSVISSAVEQDENILH